MKNILILLFTFFFIITTAQETQSIKTDDWSGQDGFFLQAGHVQSIIGDVIRGASFQEYGVGYLRSKVLFQIAYGFGKNSHLTSSLNSDELRRYGVAEVTWHFWQYLGVGLYYSREGSYYFRKEGNEDSIKQTVDTSLLGISPKVILKNEKFMITGALRIPFTGNSKIEQEVRRPSRNLVEETKFTEQANFNDGSFLGFAIHLAYIF